MQVRASEGEARMSVRGIREERSSVTGFLEETGRHKGGEGTESTRMIRQ